MVKATRDNVTDTYKGYSLSGITLVSPTVLNVSYYDDYAFMGTNGIPASTDANFKYDAETGYHTRYTASAKTFLTGTLTAKLEGSSTPSYLCSVMYFDHAGRLTTVKHKLNTDSIVTLAENTYDELGCLKTNKKNKQSALISSYAYNIRSWMKSVASPLFSQTLYYNDTYAGNTPRYNGNISAMSWSVSGENKTRGYNFTYDNLSRLTGAGYLENGNANLVTEFLYDKNGNLIKDYNKSITEISYNVLNLPQTLKISSATNTYTYAADGRKLKTAQPIFQLTIVC